MQAGVMMSMGNKKVVKIACRPPFFHCIATPWSGNSVVPACFPCSCDGSEGHLSVCWDWDVKLEPKCDH